MRILIKPVGFKASAELKEFVKAKVSKLAQQDQSIIRADVKLYEDAGRKTQKQFCEVRLHIPGNDHFVTKNATSYEESVLKSVQTLQRVLRKKKTKVLEKKRRIAAKAKKTLVRAISKRTRKA